MSQENIKLEKGKERPKGKLIFSAFTVGFFVLLFFFSVIGIVSSDSSFSENENRVLAQKPELSLHSVFDGSFMKKCESYLTDQFPFRDEAIYLKSLVERFLGKSEENGAYIGKNGFLFDSPTPFNEETVKLTAESINTFNKKNQSLNTLFLLSPNSSFIYSEYLPKYLSFEDQKQQIDSFYSMLSDDIATIDIASALSEAKNEHQVFYKTDHHWTTRGAFAAFEKASDELGIDFKSSDYEFYNVSNSFEGTLKSKVTSVSSKDNVEICVPENSQGSYFVDFFGEREKSSAMFFKEKLDQKNQYEVFLGGNYGMLTISTTVESDRKLVVIKDSYANCFLPLLTPYFSKLLVLDPRYMTESVSEIMQEDEYTDLLFIYNANTFFDDSSLRTVLG